jgi:hypothetical protein
MDNIQRMIFSSSRFLCAWWLLVLLVLAGDGCDKAVKSNRVHDFLGQRASKVLNAPDRVEVFRVAATWRKPKDSSTLAGYPLISTGKEQGKEFGGKLAEIVLDDRTYEWETAKGCKFDPGVAYRVWSGKDSIIVIICFHCDQLGIMFDESSGQGIKDCDRARHALIRLAQQAFPEDKEIQGLKE